MTETQTQVTWLTQDAHDRLKAELDDLVAQRPAIAQKINAAREEGDLKENGGYHAAREEQGVMEARIRHLQELLHTAKVGETPTESGTAVPGTVLTVRFEGDDDTETFLLGSREEGSAGSLEVYSPNSPARLGAHRRQGRRHRELRPARRRVDGGHAGLGGALQPLTGPAGSHPQPAPSATTYPASRRASTIVVRWS